jgi:hypothetical protein
MKSTKYFKALSCLMSLSLLFAVCSGILLIDKAGAAQKDNNNGNGVQKHRKVADDLSELIRNGAGDQTLKVILQLNDRVSTELASLLRSNGVKVNRSFKSLDAMALEVPSGVVNSLAGFDEVEFVSVDSEVVPLAATLHTQPGLTTFVR